MNPWRLITSVEFPSQNVVRVHGAGIGDVVGKIELTGVGGIPEFEHKQFDAVRVGADSVDLDFFANFGLAGPVNPAWANGGMWRIAGGGRRCGAGFISHSRLSLSNVTSNGANELGDFGVSRLSTKIRGIEHKSSASDWIVSFDVSAGSLIEMIALADVVAHKDALIRIQDANNNIDVTYPLIEPLYSLGEYKLGGPVGAGGYVGGKGAKHFVKRVPSFNADSRITLTITNPDSSIMSATALMVSAVFEPEKTGSGGFEWGARATREQRNQPYQLSGGQTVAKTAGQSRVFACRYSHSNAYEAATLDAVAASDDLVVVQAYPGATQNKKWKSTIVGYAEGNYSARTFSTGEQSEIKFREGRYE